jgi:hypothetical protein
LTVRGAAAKFWLAISATVSDIVLKVGGDSLHPMVADMGMAISWGSPSYFGSMIARRMQCLALRNIR